MICILLIGLNEILQYGLIHALIPINCKYKMLFVGIRWKNGMKYGINRIALLERFIGKINFSGVK